MVVEDALKIPDLRFHVCAKVRIVLALMCSNHPW